MKSKSKVYFVGAGPGDVGLLTVRGAELLARAEVVVYDRGVNPALLEMASPTAELIPGDDPDSEPPSPQPQILQLLTGKAREGKLVVRLQGGDPYVFGHGVEEAEALSTAHVPFEVVPGISAIVAGPNYAGIPLTHRQYSSSFSVFTGRVSPEQPEAALDLEQIAKLPGTKVILAGGEKIGPLAEALIARGVPAETPVSLIQDGTTGQQQTLEGTLGTIGALAETKRLSSPAITVIGDVVRLRGKLNWFEKRSLFGQRIVVTRARAQASQLTQQLTSLGAEVLEIPTIKFIPPDDKESLADALVALGEYDWLVFTSPNGVSTFFDYLFKGFEDVRALGNVRIAAVGPGTAAKIKEYHLRVDVIPSENLGHKIAEAMQKFESIENLKILLLRAEVANPELPKALEAMRAIVDDVACYKTVPETEDRTGAAAQFLAEGADWIAFTSGSTVENFHARFDLPKMMSQFPKLKAASIGPETSKALTALGIQPALEAKHHNLEGLVSALEHHVKAP